MSDTVTVSSVISVDFQRWEIPNAGRIQGSIGSQVNPTVPLNKLNPNALDALVGTWLEDVYKAAGKPCPFRKANFR